jgi:hypothetical protein
MVDDQFSHHPSRIPHESCPVGKRRAIALSHIQVRLRGAGLWRPGSPLSHVDRVHAWPADATRNKGQQTMLPRQVLSPRSAATVSEEIADPASAFPGCGPPRDSVPEWR